MQTNWYHLAKQNDDLDFPLSEIKEDVYDEDAKRLLKDRWESVESSFIVAIAYYPNAAVLEIKMKNGKKYTFMGVPEHVYEEFKNAPSKGKFFNSIIKNRYELN